MYYVRRGSTPVSTNLRKSLTFFITNIFSNKKLSKLKSGKWFGLALLHYSYYNMEIDLDVIIQRSAKVSSVRGEWNWPISCLNDSETQERGV